MKINYRRCVIEHRIGPRIYSEIMGALYRLYREKSQRKARSLWQIMNYLKEGRGKKGGEEREDMVRHG